MNDEYKPHEPKPGQRCYRFLVDTPSGSVELHAANYVHRRGGWRRWRNLASGEEWNEQGMHWYLTMTDAIMHRISWSAQYSFESDPQSSSRRKIALDMVRDLRAMIHLSYLEVERITKERIIYNPHRMGEP